jgi:hypothetical protein
MNARVVDGFRRVSLAQIDAVVTAELGPARVKGNAQPAVFNRQVAMYLAKHVGRWSTTRIGRFYHGRDHSTVCHAIKKVELMRATDLKVSALIDRLAAQLSQQFRDAERVAEMPVTGVTGAPARPQWIDELANAIVERLITRAGFGTELPSTIAWY